MTLPPKFSDKPATSEGIDLEKLRAVFIKNKWWILLIFLSCSIAGYLTTRWTKDLYESESELKLDIKRDASELGIDKLTQDPNIDVVSGEIEQIKSKLFFSRILDSLNLFVSYYSEGNVLFDEMYKRSPFQVEIISVARKNQDVPLYLLPLTETTFQLRQGLQGKTISGKYGIALDDPDLKVIIFNSGHITESETNDYYFVINSRENLVSYLSKNIIVEPLNFNANTIRISFKDHNALKARDIVNKVDSLYIFYSNEQKNLANKQKIDWLNRELEQVDKRMEAFENYFEAFTLQNKSSDLSQDMRKTINQINRLDSQRYSLNKKIIELKRLIESLVTDKKVSTSSQYSFLPDFLNKKLEAYTVVAQERDKLSLAYNENTLAFRQKEKEVSTLKDQLFGQLNQLKENWLRTLTELVDQKMTLEKEFTTMPDKNTKYLKNQRFYNLFTEFYLSMMQSKAQFEIAQAGTTPDFKILSSATLPDSPISPKKAVILAIGIVAGIVINFFFIGIVYLLNDKVTSVKEIESVMALPVLGVIPSSRLPQATTIHVNDNPKSMVSESIRSLRTNLDFFTSGGNKKIITISSSVSGEGKSFLAMNLGGVLAMSNKKVALIDLDMRKTKKDSPGLGDQNGKGLSTVLIKKNSWRECLQKTTIPNLDFIPSGPHPPNPSELLLNEEFPNVLHEIQQEYDFVVIDTPPVGLVTDGIMAMRKSDLSIYVVRANYSKKEFLKNIERIVAVNKLNNVAIVLNALSHSGKAYGYGYYEDKSVKGGWKFLFS
ncbi:MAG: polysaccharide biosynthesis tyrosine autokinase [Bacteroidetes bacterium]|nr:polysaccharide biosynthesis tyrosine autokinase [Bacteroidota bacterium]